jgi:hypothetical protein
VRSTASRPPAEGTWIDDGVTISWLLAKSDTATTKSSEGTRQNGFVLTMDIYITSEVLNADASLLGKSV